MVGNLLATDRSDGQAATEGDLLTFEVARPVRGNVVSIDGDGEMTLRLVVARQYREAVLELADALEGATARLVVVRE